MKIHTSQPYEAIVAAAAADVHEPASNTAAIVTYAAVAGKRHVITGVYWSYDITPTAATLTIEDGSGTTIFVISISNPGPGYILFPMAKAGSINTAMIITLTAGGASVTGKLSVMNHWVE